MHEARHPSADPGVDASNAPPGCVTPLPGKSGPQCTHYQKSDRRPDRIENWRNYRRQPDACHARGCSGVAIGCAGITAVIDDRGRSDLFGRKLEVTQRAVADNIASAAELVMGEADECIPAAIVRGLGMPVGDQTGIEAIDAEECLFMGVFRKNAGSF